MPTDPTLLLTATDPDRAAQHVEWLQRYHRDRWEVNEETAAAERGWVGVIGAGVMGVGIAAAHLKCGLRVALSDASAEALARGTEAILDEATSDAPTDTTAAARAAWRTRLHAAAGYERIAECDLVIESVVENAGVKQQIYRRLENRLRPHAVLASNTSTLSISALAQSLQSPERFCGLHFCNPVRLMPLVEVVRGRATSETTLTSAVHHVRRIGKMPVVVGDSPGFLVNRLLAPYLNEALQLLCEGVPMAEIEEAAVAFGMPLGPLALYDLIGLDTAFYAGRTLWEAFPDRIAVTPVLPAFIKAGRLGQKSGRGFYDYRAGGERPELAPDAARIVEPYVRPKPPLRPVDLTARLFLPMLLEATRVLESGLVSDVRDVDLGMLFGISFPVTKGGLLFWGDSIGAAALVELLQPLADLGPRFHPTALLRTLAREQRGFYDGLP
jgi:3-hydroxyacyl-CoA dehydrogenase